MTSFSTETRLRVRYAETDQMGVAYHANYLVWMEVGRTDFCRACGFRYADMEAETETHLAVAEVHCRYLASARYDDDLIITTSLKDIRSRMATFHYVIIRADTQTVLVEGETVHVVTNKAGKSVRFPEKYRQLLTKNVEF
ncbi:MAG: acyl-CoA thioesterase [Blastocatellia bacterium]|nr:acyl-CoA thioesterase [Blastocatellia bacterium]